METIDFATDQQARDYLNSIGYADRIDDSDPDARIAAVTVATGHDGRPIPFMIHREVEC